MDQSLPGWSAPQSVYMNSDNTAQPPTCRATEEYFMKPRQPPPPYLNPPATQGYANSGYETTPPNTNSAIVSNVTLVQPQQGALQAAVLAGNDVPDYMASSIINMLCCCVCFGIAAVVYSSRANSLKYVNPVQAHQHAQTAKGFNIAGFIVFCIVVIALMIVFI